ncbi:MULTISPECIES: anti-sigma factor [unclassified Gordonia (in: high G+C Gram-positive bacteria)]|uniref:anti-sigma factor n=1 Tax=unclassified Gordonia (in: high G+C Gram-positive bacteria) TaxID=2657482 RepID=UPI001B827372|nr:MULTISPECIES: anti-sigma factor [unclassified Gordonia (in: high G+C Gram-positive bacteria)]MBR7192546.1 anti-sigma factor [Gordonia sp. SCSIO 19800]UCZ88457.1 anti-sigma factor [Gordonia sp. WA4-43]
MADHLDPDAAELLEMAPLVALDALSADELRDVQARVAAAPQDLQTLFDKQVRATREALAAMSKTTATPPPPTLRDRILSAARADAGLDAPDVAGPGAEAPTGPGSPPPQQQSAPAASDPRVPAPVTPTLESDDRRRLPRRWTYLAAAAVAAVAIGAAGWVMGESSSPEPEVRPLASPAEQVFSAEDLRSTGGPVATGNVTVYLAKSADTGVLVMDSVPPPQPGTVYQMWLIGPGGARSAGTMTDQDVEPVTTAVLSGINDASTLAFTVEPPGGSDRPTTTPVAQLSLL